MSLVNASFSRDRDLPYAKKTKRECNKHVNNFCVLNFV